MSGVTRMMALWFCAACVLAAGARADVVALKSGVIITGKARVSKHTVTVETEDGRLTLSQSLVAQVTADGARSAPRGREAATGAQTGARPAVTGAPESRPRVAASEKAAAARPAAGEPVEAVVSVDFDRLPLHDAVLHLQELTGGNFAYKFSELEAVPEPVTLRLENVTVRQALNVLLRGTDLFWRTRNDIICIGRDLPRSTGSSEVTSPAMQTRVYDVRDLLWHREDHVAGRAGRRADDGARGQFGRRGSRNGTFQRGDRTGEAGRRRDRGVTESGVGRAYALGLMITEIVRPESWRQPAVHVGGVGTGRDAQWEPDRF